MLVAQLDSAADSDSAGRRFDSCRAHHVPLTKKMSSRFHKENQGFTGFSREISESPFTVDVQRSGAAFLPFGTKQLRFCISPARVYIDVFAELVHEFGFFIAVTSKGQVRPLLDRTGKKQHHCFAL